MPTPEELAASGFELEDFDHEEVLVWPENWPAFTLFEGLRTQWRSDMQGLYGLDYGVLHRELDDLGLTGQDRQLMKSDIRDMEIAALRAMRFKS